MIENVANSFKDVLERTTDVRGYMPSFFDKINTENTVDIYEPVPGRDNGKLTKFQEKVLIDDYGISYDEIKNISSWEDFENANDGVNKFANSEIVKNCPIENGRWEGERGDSKWIPDSDYVPLKKNPEQKTWNEVFEEFEIDGIDFKEGKPNFDEISKGDVEIEYFSTNRDDNFDRADIELAKQKGCSPEAVMKWRKESAYTWHECKDMKTMQKVPSIIHNNISHRGGISGAKGVI